MMTMENGRVIGYGNVGLLAMGATLLAIYFVGRVRMHTAGNAVPPEPTILGPDT